MMSKPTPLQVAQSILRVHIKHNGFKLDREVDAAIGRALGWRVSQDQWWNWHPGPRFGPPGDEWCIRKDGRSDRPCNAALPRFSNGEHSIPAYLEQQD